MSKNEMKKIREMRGLAEKVFLGKMKKEQITFKSAEDEKWFEYALRGLESDRYQ
jgi:hypothetical protein